MARKNKRYLTHQSIGEWASGKGHVHIPVPTRQGHICVACGRSVTERGAER